MTKSRGLSNLGGGFIQLGIGAVQRTVDSKLKDVVSVKDFGAVGDGNETNAVTNRTALQNAIKAAGDSGIKTVYVPAGTYIINLDVDIRAQKTNGDPIHGFELYGDGDASVLKISYGSTPINAFHAIISGIQNNGFHVRDLCFDFNASRAALRPTPSARFHNPAIQMGYGGSDVVIENCTFKDAYVDQPVRLSAFTNPVPAGEMINRVTIENCRFLRYSYGVPGNTSQDDISCIYIDANDVKISNCIFDSGLTALGAIYVAKGITAIEFNGNNFILSNNIFRYNKVAFLAKSQNADADTGGQYLMTNNLIFNCNIAIEGSTRDVASGDWVFSGNYCRVDSTATIFGSYLYLTNLPAAVPALLSDFIVSGNMFDFTAAVVYEPGVTYGHLLSSSNVENIVFTDNQVFNHPSGVMWNAWSNPAVVPSFYISNNYFKNIRRNLALAGVGPNGFWQGTTSKTIVVKDNVYENWGVKASRTDPTTYEAKLFSVLTGVSGTNLIIVGNTVMGANAATDTFHAPFTSEITTPNYNGTQTD
jgi:hypothetical protein